MMNLLKNLPNMALVIGNTRFLAEQYALDTFDCSHIQQDISNIIWRKMQNLIEDMIQLKIKEKK